MRSNTGQRRSLQPHRVPTSNMQQQLLVITRKKKYSKPIRHGMRGCGIVESAHAYGECCAGGWGLGLGGRTLGEGTLGEGQLDAAGELLRNSEECGGDCREG